MSQQHTIISLEEQLAIQEATLQDLVRRQDALQIDTARQQRLLHLERLQELASRKTTLQEARQRHLDLQDEIADALTKSQERLARVVAIAQQQQEDNDWSNSAVSKQENVEDRSEMQQVEMIQEPPVDNSEQQQDEGVIIPVPNLHLNEDVMATFLNTHNNSHGLEVFLPCLNSTNLIQRLMNLTALETLALDKSEPDGNHRQECLWTTCLDFVCVASNKNVNVASSPPNQEKEERDAATLSTQQEETDTAAIDPNIAFCPYELTGECADPYCPYQHFKPRPNNAKQQILARERLPLPTLKLPQTPSSSSVDVSTHETDLSSPPFSPLRKRRRTDAADDDDEDDEASVQTKAEEEDSAHTQALSETNDQNNENSVDEKDKEDDKDDKEDDGPVAMEWNDDFVSLPPATNVDQDSDSESSSSKNSNENQNQATAQEEPNADEVPTEVSVQEFWWHKEEDVARMLESAKKLSTLRLSVIDWLEVVAGFHVKQASDSEGVTSLIIACNGYPTSTTDAVHTLGRVVDCVRLCVHAGRFDLTHSLCDYAHQSIKQVFTVNDGNWAVGIALQMGFGYLIKARDAAFTFNSDWRSALYCAFEADVLMATLATAMQHLHEMSCINSSSLTTSLDEWTPTLDKVLAVLSRTRGQDARDSAPPESWKMLSNAFDDSERGHGKGLPPRLVMTPKGWQKMMHSSAQCPTEMLVDEVLKPTLSWIRRFADNPENHRYEDMTPSSLVYVAGYIILGCAQSACSQITASSRQDLDTSANLTAIDSCIYQIVTCLADIASTEPLADLSLAPLYSLSVSLASTLRRYGKAQRRLEAALNVILTKRRNALCGGYLIYSELLWSQLIQLRSSLPLLPDTDERKRLTSLPMGIKVEHRSIASTVNAFGVQPNHVTLCGDWNMLTAFDEANYRKYAALAHVRKFCHGLFQCLFSSTQKVGGGSQLCNLLQLPLTEVEMPMRPPSVPSLAFPRSTMLAGRDLSVLVANKCDLKELPLMFGLYFPNLKVLKLAENGLTQLPDSIGKLVSLADLDVAHNHLQSLPSTIGSLKKLTRLDASHNDLTSLPSTITKCKSLEELILANNPIRHEDLPNADLTLRCKNLYKIVVDGNV